MTTPFAEPPDFGDGNGKPGVRMDLTVNIPTLIYAVIIIIGGVVSYSNLQVDRNNFDWRVKNMEAEAVESRKERDDLRSTMKQLAENIAQTNKTLDRLSQVVDFNQQHERDKKP
jgi:hypothetical protein